jgi:very-short-patch-repair endonuclease
MPPRSRGGRLREAQPGGGIQLTSWIGKNSGMLDRGAMHSPETYLARHFRNNMTETERRLWSRLRNRQIDGYKFRRQVPVGPYFVDFLCISASLAIEVDGPFHEDESDRRKSARLEAEGYRVLRIPVTDIDETLDDVVHGIYLKLTEESLPTRISPPGSA